MTEVSTALDVAEMPKVGPVRAVDATMFWLTPSFRWARYWREAKAIKLLVDYDVVTALVHAPTLTEGYKHDSHVARGHRKQPGTTYLIDRGFWSLREFDQYCHDGVHFVTRFKVNTVLTHLTSYPVPKGSDVIADAEVLFGQGKNRMQHALRLVTVRGKDGKPADIVTNRFDLPAQVIGRLYPRRWQIELFFRWLKHHFRRTRFFGKSPQAVYAQIAAAFLAHILLVYRYRQLGYRGSLLEFARRVAGGLFAPVPPAWARATA